MILALVFLYHSAHAYWVSEHRWITEAVALELRECDPRMGGIEARELWDEIIEANLNEDRNLLRKWARDSHFYSPVRELDIRRRTSMDRVRDMEFDSTSPRTWVAGVALHHVQDASVPAHVVPVNHWIDDGFEVFQAGTPAFDFECSPHGEFAEITTLTGVLQKTAEITLARTKQRPWNLFWSEGKDGAFGTYGVVGNVFGTNTTLDRKFYRDFKLGQSRLAMDATRAVLRILSLHPALFY